MQKNCQLCQKIFTTKPSYIKRGHGKFCSLSCSARFGGILRKKSIEQTKSKARKKQKLIEWHKQQGRSHCQIPNCVFELTLDLHRIEPGKNGGQYTKQNTTVLCPNHHAIITRKIKSYQELKGQ